MSELVKQSNQRKLATITVDDNLTASPFKPGMIIPTGRATADEGFLLCHGQSVLKSAYPALLAAIGTVYGSVDSDHFTLPDLRGVTPVGAGNTGANSANANWVGPNLGATQNDQTQDHVHFSGSFSFSSSQTTNVTQSIAPSGPYFKAVNYIDVYNSGYGSPFNNAMLDDNKHGAPRAGYYTRGPGVGVNFQIKY